MIERPEKKKKRNVKLHHDLNDAKIIIASSQLTTHSLTGSSNHVKNVKNVQILATQVTTGETDHVRTQNSIT